MPYTQNGPVAHMNNPGIAWHKFRKNGEPAGVRTLDLLIKSQLLYQLSYRLSPMGHCVAVSVAGCVFSLSLRGSLKAWAGGVKGKFTEKSSYWKKPFAGRISPPWNRHARPWACPS